MKGCLGIREDICDFFSFFNIDLIVLEVLWQGNGKGSGLVFHIVFVHILPLFYPTSSIIEFSSVIILPEIMLEL